MIGFPYLYAMLAEAFGGAASTPAYDDYRPTGSALRNPANPVQAARIAAAMAKRERRADLRLALASRATLYNRAHHTNVWKHVRPSLNPFYVAK